MRRLFTTFLALGLIFSGLQAQDLLENYRVPRESHRTKAIKEIPNAGREVICGADQLLYPAFKAQSNFIDLYFMSNVNFFSAGSQAFQLPQGASVTVTGMSFQARNAPRGNNASVTVNCEIYNLNANRVPVGQPLATTTVTMDTSSNAPLYTATFSTPVTVTQDFTVVVANPTDSTITLAASQAGDQDGRGEFLAGLRRPQPTGWVNGQTVGVTQTQNFDADWQIFPIVEYSFDASFVADRNCLLQEEPNTFTSTSSSILGSKFFNRWVFNEVFEGEADSTFRWDFNGDNQIDAYGEEVQRTYPQGGASSVKVFLSALNFGWTANGVCNDIDSAEFTSGPRANPLFSVDSIAPKTYEFEALPAPFNETYIWEFGDGTVDNTSGFTATHTYSVSDTFTVTLTTTSCETDSSTTQTFFVTPDFAANRIGENFQHVGVYPNPATDVLNVELELDKVSVVSLDLTDLAGRLVMSQEAGTIQKGELSLDVSGVKSGVYILSVRAGEENTQKIVVLK